MLLVVDNGSIYTKHLLIFLSQKKINFQNIEHDKISFSDFDKYTSFILSGRRKNDKKMNVLNSKLIHHTITEKKKLLGICYGAEILALALGGTIKKMNAIQKGEQDITTILENPLCSGRLKVFQSHNYQISQLNEQLVTVAESETCQHEIIKHHNLDIFGTQFHPEMSKDGQKIIESFVSI